MVIIFFLIIKKVVNPEKSEDFVKKINQVQSILPGDLSEGRFSDKLS